MASPQDFMERVMAWPGLDGPGYVNLHWTKDGKWRGRPFKTCPEFMQMAQWLTNKASVAKDIYFCTTVQSQTGKSFGNTITAQRNKEHATFVKAIWLDVDVKPPPKGYATFPEAIDAISKFVTEAKLPPATALIHSGGGIHIYWISDCPLTVLEWLPYAEALKSEAMRLGLRADYGCTADAARVLRVPGTFNRKLSTERPVKVLALGADLNFETELTGLKALGDTIKTVVTATVTGTAAVPPFDLTAFKGQQPAAAFAALNAQADNLSEGLNVRSDLPLIVDEMIVKCPHFLDAATNNGKGHNQGLWMQTILATTWLEDGRRWAHYFSKGYPSYDPDEVDKMFDRKVLDRAERNLGWPSCHAFENDGCKGCATCPLKGTIKSPLHLAERAAPPLELAAPVAPAPQSPEEMHMPPGYVVDPESQIVCALVAKEIQGVTNYDKIPLFHNAIDTPFIEGDPIPALHFFVNLGRKVRREVTITDEQMALDQTLIVSLNKQLCKTKTFNEKFVRDFMKSWVTQIEEAFKRQTTAPFGWVFEDGDRKGFAYGGKVFLDNGQEGRAGHPFKSLELDYRPAGTPEPMLEVMDIISEQHVPQIEIMAAAAFAAPLLYVTGEDFGVLWAWSDESGAHKSTSILAGGAVWGDPKRTKENSSASIIGLQLKLAQLRHLPLYIDELKTDEQIDAIETQIGVITEGKDGVKGKRDRTLQVAGEWQTMLTCGSNRSIRDRMTRRNKQTDASLRRVFEFKVPKLPDTRVGTDVRRLTQSLSQHHGWLGLAYAKYIGTNWSTIEDRGKQIEADLIERVKYKSEERFWLGACTTVLLGAEIANKVIGKDVFHLDEIRTFLIEAYKDQRKFIDDNMNLTIDKSAEDLIAGFLKHFADSQLWTAQLIRGSGRRVAISPLKMPPRDRGLSTVVRWYRDDRLVHISRSEFVGYLDKIAKVQPVTAIEGVLQHFHGNIPASKINLIAGCGIGSQTPEMVIEIPIPAGSFLDGSLHAYSDPETGPAPTTPTPEPTHSGPTGILAGAAQAQKDLDLVRTSTAPQPPSP